jgi:peptidoglycan-associated lipoprotein
MVSAPRRSTFNPLGFIVAAFLFAAMLAGCPPSYPNCDNDGHCKKYSEVCVDGKCKQCKSDATCTALDACMTCQANACVRTAGCCKSDLDCPDGRCAKGPGETTGTCVAGCSSKEDCPAGQRCQNGACVPDVGCSDDSFCPAGQKCQNGECVVACELEPVYFDFNEHVIKLSEESKVSGNADCIKTSGFQVAVEGHCDERGSDEYNLALGQRRANSLARQYKALGIGDGNIKGVISFGEERPTCNEPSESCWTKNRRAETVRK